MIAALLWMVSVDWQAAATAALGPRAGAVVVLDASTGVRLGVAHPSTAERRLARPGSTAKPFALLALFQSHRATPSTAIVCKRRLTLDGRRLDCTHPVSPLPFDATAAVAYSCNWWFASVASRMEADKLAETYRRAGLSTGGGVIRTARSVDELRLQALGEAAIEVTPLGLAAAYRRLAARRLLSEPPDDELAAIYASLESAAEYGTARLAAVDGLKVAGKTGTTREVAWFAGFAPSARPEIVVVVMVERGSGGGDAAPVAKALFERLLH
jgi:cell division protein FtsI/penicillin-binding protein 2